MDSDPPSAANNMKVQLVPRAENGCKNSQARDFCDICGLTTSNGIVRLNTDVCLASPNPILDKAKLTVLLGETPNSYFQNQSKSAAQP